MPYFITESKMHLLSITLALLSTNAIGSDIQHFSYFHQTKTRSLKVPKSIFITPLLEPCARGYVQNENGKCLRLIKIDESTSTPNLLDRLRNAFTGHQKKKKRLKEQQTKVQVEDSKEKTRVAMEKEVEPKEQTHNQKEEANEKLLTHEEGHPAEQAPQANKVSKVQEQKSKSEHEPAETFIIRKTTKKSKSYYS